MNRKTKNTYKLLFKINTIVSFLVIGLFFGFFAFVVFVDVELIKSWFETEKAFQYAMMAGFLTPLFIGIVTMITRQFCMGYLQEYYNRLQSIRSARNFSRGLQWLEQGRYEQAINVYDTIKHEKSRSFFYHILLMRIMKSNDDLYREACEKAFNQMIEHYSTPENYI